jgi:hypothetical protein
MPNEAAAHLLGRQTFSLPAHQTTDVVSTCKPTKQAKPVHIMGITPHMHLAGIQAKSC